MIAYPCKNCEKRHPDCHQSCIEYMEIKIQNREEALAWKKYKESIYGGIQDGKERMRKNRAGENSPVRSPKWPK